MNECEKMRMSKCERRGELIKRRKEKASIKCLEKSLIEKRARKTLAKSELCTFESASTCIYL